MVISKLGKSMFIRVFKPEQSMHAHVKEFQFYKSIVEKKKPVLLLPQATVPSDFIRDSHRFIPLHLSRNIAYMYTYLCICPGFLYK